MLTGFTRLIVNIIYLVPLKVRIFSARHAGETIQAAGASKAISLSEDQQVTRGYKWIVSKRAALILSNKRLACGSWNIELSQIVEAKLIKLRSMLGTGLVLKVRTNQGKHYQFGLQYDQKWFDQKVLPMVVEDGKIMSSTSSKIFRLVVWVYITYLLFQLFSK